MRSGGGLKGWDAKISRSGERRTRTAGVDSYFVARISHITTGMQGMSHCIHGSLDLLLEADDGTPHQRYWVSVQSFTQSKVDSAKWKRHRSYLSGSASCFL